MSGFRALERSLVAALRRGTVDYVDGVVVSTSPYRVLCTGEDEAAELIPLAGGGAVDDRVAALAVGPRRFGIPFAATAADLGPLATRVAALETTVNTGSNRNSLLRSDLTSLAARVTALEADTGWQPLTPVVGVTGNPRYRVMNGLTHLSGRLTRTAGNWGTGYGLVLTLPTIAAPVMPPGESLAYTSGANRFGDGFLVALYASGNVQLRAATAANDFELNTIPPFPAV